MRRSPSLVVGAAICSLIGVLALTGGFWTPHDPLMVDATRTFDGPSAEHLLGTDQLGRDVLSNVWQGARTSVAAAVLAAAIAMFIGGLLGVAAATARRWLDDAIMALSTIFVAFPALLLALLIVAARGPSTSTTVITVAVAAGAAVAVVTRRDAADILAAPYVMAARFCGATGWRVVQRHLLRNLVPSLCVQATGAAAVALVAESTLSYLGLGTTPPTPSWGRMLASTQQYLLVHPLLTIWPALFVCATVLGLNLLGDGLRERFDPNLRG